jgi:hypothetical protein
MGYTCKDYRIEMMLLSLKQRLENENLRQEEKRELRKQVEKLEAAMGMDE